jgi:hypothetical protein
MREFGHKHQVFLNESDLYAKYRGALKETLYFVFLSIGHKTTFHFFLFISFLSLTYHLILSIYFFNNLILPFRYQVVLDPSFFQDFESFLLVLVFNP